MFTNLVSKSLFGRVPFRRFYYAPTLETIAPVQLSLSPEALKALGEVMGNAESGQYKVIAAALVSVGTAVGAIATAMWNSVMP